MGIVRTAAIGLLALAGAAGTVPGIAGTVPGIAEPPDSVPPPSVTISARNTDHCPQRLAPPPPVDASEQVPPGVTSPAPVPVPDRAVGGPLLAGCGLVLPAGAGPVPPDISAAAWLIADADSGQVLAAKDPHGRYRPASTLKLLTANVILRQLPTEQVVTGTAEDAAQEGSAVGLGPGGQYTVNQLLHFLLMRSGNDAAFALARANGGFDKTVADMNARARELGALDTQAATVSGLDGPAQMTSAYDLALITRANLQIPLFVQAIGTRTIEVPGWPGRAGYRLGNDNKLLTGYRGALGGKTGFTDDAGNTFVGIAQREGRTLVVTMLAGTQRPRKQWMQAASLLDFGFALPPGTSVGRLVTGYDEATASATTMTSTSPTGPTGPTGPTEPAPTTPTTPTASPATAAHIPNSSSTSPAIAPTNAPGGPRDPTPADPTDPVVALGWALGSIALVTVGGALVLRRRAKQQLR